MMTIEYKSLRAGFIIHFHGANLRVTAVRNDGPSEYYPGEDVYSFDVEPADEEAIKLLGNFYSHGTYGGVGFLTTELVKMPYGYYNGTPYYTEEEYKYAIRHHGAFESDEELLAFCEKASRKSREKLLLGYISDYCLEEPRRSLTRAEFERLRELSAEAQAAHKAAEEAREWHKVKTIYWADNSVEEIWEDRDGIQKSVMAVGPHGDVC